MSALAFPVVVVALMSGAAWLVGALAFPVGTAFARHQPAAARALPLVAALPLLAALVLGAAAVLPGDPHLDQPFGCHCSSSMPAWSHLCPVHPEEAEGLLPLALLVLAVWLPGRLRPLRERLLQPRGVGTTWSAPVHATLTHPTAVLVGWLRPTLVVDPRLWEALSPAEQNAVLAHEWGHLARRDPLVLMALQVLTLAAPRRAAAELTRTWLEHAERRADALAARDVGDPLLVAEALLRCARLGAAHRALAVGWTGGSLEQRVQRLLADDGAAVSGSPDVGLPEAMLLGAAAILALGTTPWVHHHVEHLLNLSL